MTDKIMTEKRIYLYDFENDRQYSVAADSEEGKAVYIQQLIGSTADVIERAMKHPGLQPKRKPTIENAMKAVASEVEVTVLNHVKDDVQPKLQEMYDMYTLMNGEYADSETEDDYSNGLDDEVERVLEPHTPYLSADWLGRNTIDTRLWEDQAIQKLAQSVGKEVFKQLSYGKTPAQVLSNAGIVQADVEIFFEQHLAQPQPEAKGKKMTEGTNNLAGVVSKIRAQVGADFDLMTVYEDIELAADDDEILANGAAKRLGLDDADLGVLQMASLEYGEDTAQTIVDMVKAAPEKAKPAPKAERAKTEPKAKAEGAVDPQVLKLYKDHGGGKDTEMAADMGVSRATYNNWLNGKNAFNPDEDQYKVLRAAIVKDVNGLLEALALLDGTERQEIA